MPRHALILGASGGIGSALAVEARARGYAVTTLSRRADGFDVTRSESVQAHLAPLEGPFDLILLATGLLAPKGARPEKSLAEIDAETMAQVIAVNTIGPALVLRDVVRLLPRDTPSVVGVLTARVGSIGDNQLGGWYAYRAAKAAANQITRTAAIEIGRKRPLAAVVALHPGTVDTPFTAGYPSHHKVTPEQAAQSLLDVCESRQPDHNGGFFAYDGQSIPW